MLQITNTRNNQKTISINKVTLHSKYSPQREAEKFIQENLKTNTTLIVLGAALGYIFPEIAKCAPKIDVISIPYNNELGIISRELNNTNRMQWNRETPINDFLKTVISSEKIKGLQILEWLPSTKAFPNESRLMNSAIITCVRRVNGNLLTTARFGRAWIRNSIKNYLVTDEYISSFIIERPIALIASGSSLKHSFELLKANRNKITIISLSSANMALNTNGITPDLTFSTDPGYYSKLHIYNNNYPTAMPLTNSTSNKNPVLLLNQNNFFEKQIIELGNLPSIKINENGTVAGTALQFALKQNNKPVFIFGLDLESKDIEGHISPYTFDNLLEAQSNKTDPYYSIMFKRWANEGVSFKTYRDWFTSLAEENKDRLFRVNSSSKAIPQINDVESIQFTKMLTENVLSQKFSYKISKAQDISIRYKNVQTMLKKWEKSLQIHNIEKNPLFYLISTSNYTDVNNKSLSNKQQDSILNAGKEETILFIKRLLDLYGRKLL